MEPKSKVIIGISVAAVFLYLAVEYRAKQSERLEARTQAAQQVDIDRRRKAEIEQERWEREREEMRVEQARLRGGSWRSESSISAAGIGRSYDQIMQGLSSHFTMRTSSPVQGNERIMGSTSDRLALIEVIGPRDSIVQTSLIIGVPSDAPAIVARNTTLLLRFINNAVPDWTGGVDWTTSVLRRIAAGGEGAETIRNGRTIKLQGHGQLGMIIITVK